MIWVLTPKTGRGGHVEPSEIAEAALTAVARISRMLTETDPKAIDRAELHGFLDDLQLELGHLHGAIASTWFPAPAEAA